MTADEAARQWLNDHRWLGPQGDGTRITWMPSEVASLTQLLQDRDAAAEHKRDILRLVIRRLAFERDGLRQRIKGERDYARKKLAELDASLAEADAALVKMWDYIASGGTSRSAVPASTPSSRPCVRRSGSGA